MSYIFKSFSQSFSVSQFRTDFFKFRVMFVILTQKLFPNSLTVSIICRKVNKTLCVLHDNFAKMTCVFKIAQKPHFESMKSVQI